MSKTKNYNWLTQNSKIKKSTGVRTYNWGIPTIVCCPNAGVCKYGCYANMGAYRFSNVKSVFNKRYELTKSSEFINIIDAEIKRRNIKRVRIHDSGDFYSYEYYVKWITIAQLNPDVVFYAYTKMVRLTKALIIPDNMQIIFSYGGTEDQFINPNTDRHSKVFESRVNLIWSGYIDASKDDNLALGKNHRIGLIYHGNKGYDKTKWSNSNAR